MSEFFNLVSQLETSINNLDKIIAGGDNETVNIDGQEKNTISKAIKDQFASLQAQIQGRLSYATKALLDADLAHNENTLAEVWNDAIPEHNGLYGKLDASGAGSWKKSNFDYLVSALQAVTNEANERKSLVDDQPNIPGDKEFVLADKHGNIIFSVNADGSISFSSAEHTALNANVGDYQYAICDNDDNIVFAIKGDGSVEIPKLLSNTSNQNWHKLTLKNSDTIANIGDSHTASHYTLKDKAYISNLSNLSDYRHQNFGRSGNDALDMNYRIVNDSPYFDGQKFSDLNPKYAFIATHDNDGQFLSSDLTYYQQNISRLLDTVLATGAAPVLCSEFNATSDERAVLSAISHNYQIPFVDNASDHYELGDLQVNAFFQGHPGTRTNGIMWLNMLAMLDKLPAPDKGIKIFRKRSSFTANELDDLLYQDRVDRYHRFQELGLTHYHLSNDTQQYYDELDRDNVYTHVLAVDEYSQLLSGQSVNFTDYALVEIVLPGTAYTLDEVKVQLNISDNTNVYVRDYLDTSTNIPGKAQGITPESSEFLAKVNQPRGTWRAATLSSNEISLLQTNLRRSLKADKLVLLLHKSGGFTLNDISVDYRGTLGKPAKHLLPDFSLGDNVLTLSTCTSADLANWSKTGTPTTITPLDVVNAPRAADGVNPVAQVTLINADNTLAQTVTLPKKGGKYVLTAWCRYFPKAFLDNSHYSFDASQVIDSSQSSTDFDDSLITADSADLRTLQLEFSNSASLSSIGGIIAQDFACLSWRRVEFYLDLGVPPLATDQLTFKLSSPDSELQLAKVLLQEIR